MPDPAAALTSLLRASSIEDHEEVLKAANAALKADKSSIHAQHTRVVALLKLDRFDDALRAITEGGDKAEKECLLEKAYALYKTGQLDGADDAITQASSSSRAFRHLAAQVAYRAEKFQDAVVRYDELKGQISEAMPGEENDVKINTLAVNAQLEWVGLGHLLDAEQRQPAREDLEVFETAYNAACGCAARGDFNKASVLLKRARDLCEASEDLTEDEKKAELLPIMVQHVYVLTRLGKDTEAAALEKGILVSEIPEPPTRVAAQNNQLALDPQDRNPYLTQRLIESATKLSGNDHLFEFQASVLQRNKYALDLQAQKFEGVGSTTSNIISKATTPTTSAEIAGLGVINAAAHAHLQGGKAAIKAVLPLLEKRPTDIGLLLTLVQLYVQVNDSASALSLLETFLRRLEAATAAEYGDVRFAPGLVATVVALYRLQGRHNSVRTELSRAAAHWRSKSPKSAASLLREAGVELLKSSTPGDLAAAGQTFEALVSVSKHDQTAVAGLVASYATTDYNKIESYLDYLTPIDRLTTETDVRALADTGVASVAQPKAQAKKRAAETEPDKPTKRRRKRRLPKDYEEGKKPDPERWLPLRDRSTYRPKGRKGKKRAHDATQGGLVKEEETLELVGGAGAVKVEKTTGGGGKKKKKGKK